MRRSRFAGAVKTNLREPRAAWLDTLSFDLRPPLTSDDSAIAEQRLSQLTYVPLLLGVAHLISSIAILLHYGFAIPARVAPLMFGTMALALLFDLAALAFMRMRERLEVSPRTVTLVMSLVVLASSSLWTLFGHAASMLPDTVQSGIIPIVIGTVIVASAVAVSSSPPLAVVCAFVGTLGAAIVSGDPAVVGGIATMSMVVVGYSVGSTRTMIATAHDRLLLDHEAHKALHFVNEFENSGRGWFWETNSQGTLSYVSQQLADDFQTEPETLLGRQFTTLLSVGATPDTALREERTLGFHLSARFPFSDVIVRAATNADVHWSLSGNPVFDDHGRYLGFRGIGTDLTEQRRSEQEISRLARFDSLTGLPNRAMMRQTLDEALRNAARRQRGCSLFLIDLDRFKNVNDTLGHPIGDLLLKAVAGRLTSAMGELGQIGRLGGDEFKAVLPGTVDIGLLESLAKTLIEQVSRPYMIEGHRVTIGASVGVAIGDPGRACADSMIRNADLALYAAKGDGRGRHAFYQASMHSEASDRQILENDLRQVLDRNELSVMYQPIVRTTGEEISGFEALVRWQHPKRGPISPTKFIPLAEECGMIAKIGEWVLNTALTDAAKWPDDVRIAVNLSPIQFNDPAILEVVAKAIDRSGIKPVRVELEITEGVFLAEGDAADETFAGLKKLGVRLALDDFGTGYSSLGYLKKAPFDKIKIDQSFVRGAASISNRNAAIIRAIVTLADSLGMDTTAEGVETHDDLQLMRELGVSQIQGYIFGRPGTAEVALELTVGRSVTADGHQCVREPRQRLMRRAVTMIQGKPVELRIRNISAMGTLVECDVTVAPGLELAIDMVGIGPVAGVVRWSTEGRFGVQFHNAFDTARLAPKKVKSAEVPTLNPWYAAKAAG